MSVRQDIIDVLRFKKTPIGAIGKNVLSKDNLKKIEESLVGSKDQFKQVPLYNQQQMSAQSGLLEQALQNLANTPQGLEDQQVLQQQLGGFNGLGGSTGQQGGFWSGLGGLAGGALGGLFGGPTGAALGSQAGSSFANWLGQDKQQQQYNPGDYASALQQLGGAAPQNQLNFAPIKQNAIAEFREKGIPSIAARFGKTGGHRSGAFAQALSSGEQGLRRGLASDEQQANLQNFTANQAARQAQQNAALSLLSGNRAYQQGLMGLGQGQQRIGQGQQQLEQNQQRIGQGQQSLNLQQLLGQGQLAQSQQRLNLANLMNRQNQNQQLLQTGLRPQFENAFMAGKPGLLQPAAQSFAQYLPFLMGLV